MQTKSNRPRTEPTFGELDKLDTDAGRSRIGGGRGPASGRSRPPLRVWPWLLLVALVLLAGALFLARDHLRDWLPGTELNQLLQRADVALADGRLAGASGESARELYSAALALAHDNERARKGLEAVGNAQLARARVALTAGELARAAQSLAEARALLGGGTEVDKLAAELAEVRGRNTEVAVLIERADAALADGRIEGPGGAGALYAQVLQADPGNAVAAHGIDKVTAVYGKRIQQAIVDGQLDAARRMVDAIAAVAADSGDLPALRARLAEAERMAGQRLAKALAAAKSSVQRGRLIGDDENNALAQYQAVLQEHPENAEAKAGLIAVASSLLLRAQSDLKAGDLQEARVRLQAAKPLLASDSELRALHRRLSAEATRIAMESASYSPPAPSAEPPPPDPAEVAQLLTRAHAAASAGDLMLPPGQSAYDLYHAVLDLDPDNIDAMAGLADLPGQARRLFGAAIEGGQLGQAGDQLQTFQQLLPGSSTTDTMRAQLTDAWLDQAEAAIAAGRLGAAKHAVEEARKLAPKDPRIGALLRRISGQ